MSGSSNNSQHRFDKKGKVIYPKYFFEQFPTFFSKIWSKSVHKVLKPSNSFPIWTCHKNYFPQILFQRNTVVSIFTIYSTILKYNFDIIKKRSSSEASYRKSSKRNHDVKAVVTISDKSKSTVFDRYGQMNHNFLCWFWNQM